MHPYIYAIIIRVKLRNYILYIFRKPVSVFLYEKTTLIRLKYITKVCLLVFLIFPTLESQGRGIIPRKAY